MTFFPLVALCFVHDKPEVKFMCSINNIELKNVIIWLVQNTTALESNVFLTGMYWLLGIDKGRPAFPKSNYQGQLRPPVSISTWVHIVKRSHMKNEYLSIVSYVDLCICICTRLRV
jgi:hypothetical protein